MAFFVGQSKGWVKDVVKRREKVVSVPEKVTKTGGGGEKCGQKSVEEGEETVRRVEGC